MTLDDLANLKKTRTNKRVREILEERAAEPIVQAQFRVMHGNNAITSNSMSTVGTIGTGDGAMFTVWRG